MAQRKHTRRKGAEKEIIIREKTVPEHGDYYDDEPDEQAASAIRKERNGKKIRPKSYKMILRILIIVVLLIAALIFWFNRENFAPENISNWFQTKLMGAGIGDGYPVQITGANVKVNNFTSKDGNAVMLSNTALTSVNSTGKEIFRVPHSYNEPAMKIGGDRYIIYNRGGENYSIVSAEKGEVKLKSENKVTAADISPNGKYAVLSQPSDYSAQLDVYKKDGKLQFYFKFAEGYGTAMALNSDGSKGAVATVAGKGGELYTKLYVFDFSTKDPVAEYTSNGNIVSEIYWSGDTVYAVGDVSTIVGATEFSEYNYEGKQLTAVSCENGKAFVSVSSYSHAGASELLIFNNTAEPSVINVDSRITDISSYGGTVSVLAGHYVNSYDMYSLNQTGTCQAGYDAKGISLINESDVYVLGVREIRYATIQRS